MVAAGSQGPALLTALVAEPGGYGRVVRDAAGAFAAVVEDKDASPEQKQIPEINSGVLAAPAAQLRQWLPEVGNNNSQGEYYLPDILSLAVSQGITVATCQAAGELEILGVNDRVQLNQVEREYQQRQAHALMLSGVTLADADRIDVRGTLSCGTDVYIDANAVFIGDVTLGSNVQIGANCVLINTSVDDGSEILPFSHLEQARVGKDCAVGPYARLRPAAVLAEGAKIGNFVEVKKSTIGKGSKVNHLTYIGDCEMGAGVNVGAGTITCNYDGANKYVTTIGDGAFVGSNSTLVAPLTIAENGFIGAGSAITREVGSDQLAVSRAKHRNIDGWKRPVKD